MEQLQNYGTEQQPLYKMRDLSSILQIDRNSNMLIDMSKNTELCQRQKIQCVTFKGVQQILQRTRGQVPQWLSDKFQCDQVYRYVPKETELYTNLQKALKQFTLIWQYPIGDYFIDIYIEKYNIAIEIDEYGHQGQQEDDQTRQQYIEKQLQCTFYRINPDENDFNLFDHISNIYQIIMQ